MTDVLGLFGNFTFSPDKSRLKPPFSDGALGSIIAWGVWPFKAQGQSGRAMCRQGNMLTALMECVKTRSLGQISGALYEVGGLYRRNM